MNQTRHHTIIKKCIWNTLVIYNFKGKVQRQPSTPDPPIHALNGLDNICIHGFPRCKYSLHTFMEVYFEKCVLSIPTSDSHWVLINFQISWIFPQILDTRFLGLGLGH